MVGGLKRVTGGSEIDYSQDFFGRRAYLTVSGQLNGEYYASALSNIYTFGPTFRAEESHTSRHLAEFWMIEPEMAFCALEDDMQCAEDYVRHCCKHILQSSGPDLDFLVDRYVSNHCDVLVHASLISVFIDSPEVPWCVWLLLGVNTHADSSILATDVVGG